MRGIKSILLGVVLFILINPFSSNALARELDEKRISEERLKLAEDYFNEQMQNNNIIGGVFGITYQDKLIRSQGYGKIDKKTNQMPNEKTVYSIASVTKSFTASAIYQLQDEGLLHLDEPIRTYIPWFRFKQEKLSDQITLRHLLTHSAGGIGSFQTDGLIFAERKARDSLEDYVRLFKTIEVQQKPGQSGNYCNGCYDILGLVIEYVSGLSYYDYIQQNILDPLQMKETVFGTKLNQFADSRLAKEYTWFFTQKVHINRSFEAFGSAQDPDGGLYSTIEDLSKFLSAQLGFTEHPLMNSQSIADSRTDHVSTELFDALYTASGFETKQLHQNKIFYKTGDGVGSASAILFIPEQDLGVTLLLGEFHPEIQLTIVEGISAILLGYEPDFNSAPFTFGKTLGILSIALLLAGIVFLGFLIRRFRKKSFYAKSLSRSILSWMGYGAAAAAFWLLLLKVRPTSIGFYGYPYDLAIGILMITGALSLWFIYFTLVISLKKYNKEKSKNITA
ncbi:serine hydrolase domain-containing protein [Paenibacillus sp. GXUN7292]|uniref:serine hydrolase domain-containing protein n=1 Tax=Paenibacillus sp. GXUN7292 TaxID=3422499 RepID=UPI003D7DD009